MPAIGIYAFGSDQASAEQVDDIHRPATPEDQAISDAMAAYWTNFAKRGDPKGKGVPAWPAFSDANPVVMYFAGTAHTGPIPSEGRCECWMSTSPRGVVRKGAAVKP